MTMTIIARIIQVLLGIFGSLALILTLRKSKSGPIVGLATQPLWFYVALSEKLWGLFVVSLAYTLSWAYGTYLLFKAQPSLGPVKKTSRGFEVINFQDMYEVPCSLQDSSLSDIRAVWLGCNDSDPKILAKDAIKLGLKPQATYGWQSYLLPPEVQTNTRAHLDQKQVQALIRHLQQWLTTGHFGKRNPK